MYEMHGVTQRTLDTRAMICGVEADWEAEPATVAVDLADEETTPVAAAGIAADAQHRLHLRVAPGAHRRRRHRDDRGAPVRRWRPCWRPRPGRGNGRRHRRRRLRPPAGARSRRRLRRRPHPSTSRTVRVICSAGVAWSADTKRRLLDHLPTPRCSMRAARRREARSGSPSCAAATTPPRRGSRERAGTIIVDDHGEEAPIGETGLIAAVTHTTGYYKHPEKTAETFRDDRRPSSTWSPAISGASNRTARSHCSDAGTLGHQHGRREGASGGGRRRAQGTPGGDRRHRRRGAGRAPRAGRGRRRAAGAGRQASETDITAAVREKLAGYKAPRRIVFVDEIPRAPNGKADLARARQLAAEADPTAVP